MPTSEFVITGSGVASAGGMSPAALHSALCEGDVQVRALQGQDPNGDECRGIEIADFAAEAILGDVNLRPLDRCGQLAVVAAHLVLDAVGLPAPTRDETGLDIGITTGTVLAGLETILDFDAQAVRKPRHCKPMDFANTVLNAATGQTALWHDLRGASSTIATGSDSALQALHQATVLLEGAQAEAMLAGGFDALSRPAVFVHRRAGLLAADPATAVPFGAGRDGIVLGEGAAFVFIESAAGARERGADVMARILGTGRAWDSTRGQDPASLERALVTAIRSAIASASIQPGDLDVVFASAAGSRIVDSAEARAIATVLGADVTVTAPKGLLGESLGASGALAVLALLETMRKGVIPGIAGLDTVGDDIPLTGLLREPTQRSVRHGLVTALGHDGSACAVLIEAGAS